MHSIQSLLIRRTSEEALSTESIFSTAIKLEFEAYIYLAQNHVSRELHDAENAKLNELVTANKILLAPITEHCSKRKDCRFCVAKAENIFRPNPNVIEALNLTVVVVPQLINMVKKLHAFQNMCQEDQIALMKGGCLEIMILKSAVCYDLKNDIWKWKVPCEDRSSRYLKSDLLKMAKGNLYQNYKKFVKTFDSRWRCDKNINLMLLAIILFTPNRPCIIHRDVVRLEQSSYYYLLRRYLNNMYSGCEAKSMFLKLLQKVTEIRRIKEEIRNLYIDVKISEVEPLLLEVFDLK